MNKDVEAVVEDILNEGRRRAQEIIEKAKREAEAILNAAKIQVEEEKITKLKKFEEQEKSLMERMIAEERTKTHMEFLTEREKIVEEIFEEIMEILRKLGESAEYKRWLIEIVLTSCSEFDSRNVILSANMRDTQFLQSKIDEISKKCGKVITIGKPIQTIGGVRIESEDGKVAIDQTLENLVRQNREKIRTKIAKLLG